MLGSYMYSYSYISHLFHLLLISGKTVADADNAVTAENVSENCDTVLFCFSAECMVLCQKQNDHLCVCVCVYEEKKNHFPSQIALTLYLL